MVEPLLRFVSVFYALHIIFINKENHKLETQFS